MSVVATAPYTTATGNGVATSFPFAFACRNVADVAVYVNGIVQNAGITVTLGSDFNSGTVAFTTAPANAAAIIIASQPSLAQQIQFENAGAYNPITVDGMADAAAIRSIYLAGLIARTAMVPLGETMGAYPAKTVRAGQYLAFDAAGNPVAAGGTGGGDLNLRTDLAAASGAALVGYGSSSVQAVLNQLFGPFLSSPNYVGTGTSETFTISQGSVATPSTTADSTMVVEKTANCAAFNAFSTLAFKISTASNARATAHYSEATDNVGGSTSFVEGHRSQGTLTGGANGSAYGQVSVAGTGAAAGGPTTPKYLIAHEGEVDNQIGPDSSDFTAFNKDNYFATYVATNGVGPGTRYKIDAAFVTNPYSLKPFRTGLLITENSVDHTAVACRAVALVNGIDMHLATFSGYAVNLPGFTIDGTGNVKSTASIGFGTGAGGAVTQLTSRTTGVALNKACGQITLFSAAGSATWQTFTVTNSTVAATDVVRLNQASGADKYMLHVTHVGAGTFDVTFATTGGTTTEQPVFNFAVIKAVAA